MAIDIAAGLEANGYSTWYYERDSLPGPSYLLQTSSQIEKAQAVVLIISPDSLGSNQVTKEVIRAHESGKPFVPVLKSISHVEFANRQPEWKEAVGSATSITGPRKGTAAIIPRILEGLRGMGIEPSGANHTPAGEVYPTLVPTQRKPLFQLGSFKVFPWTAVIAAVLAASLVTGGLVLASNSRSNEGPSTVGGQPMLRARTSNVSKASAPTAAESAQAPVSTREINTSEGIVVIDRIKVTDRYMECPTTGKCIQHAGGKFILGLTLRSKEGKSASVLQARLTQEALSSYVKTPEGRRVEAFNFDLLSGGKSSITVIYAYLDAAVTNGLTLYWKGNPPIAFQSAGEGGSSDNEGTGTAGSSGSSGSTADNDTVDEEPPPEDPDFTSDDPTPVDEEPPPEEPPPDEPLPPDEEPPPA